MPKTIQEYTKEVVATMSSYQKAGTKKWNAHTAVFDLSVQIGSLTKLFMQLENTRNAHGMSKKELKAKVGDELADIFTEVLFIAHELDIDIEDAFAKMLESDKQKVSSYIKKKK
jgi:hypothetical protein